MQSSYSLNQPVAFAGLKGNARFDYVESKLAQNAIPFGRAVVSGDNKQVQVRLPMKNKTTLSVSADLIASNSTIVTVNGVATTATVYGTSHVATMEAIRVKIAALAGVLSATYAGSGRDIVIVGDNVVVTASAVTTLGSSQPTWSEAQTTNDIIRGLSLHQHVEKDLSTGVAEYLVEDAVNVLRQGCAWMVVEPSNVGTMAIDLSVYANLAVAGQEGKVTSVSASNIAISTGVCRELTTGPDGETLALVEINLP